MREQFQNKEQIRQNTEEGACYTALLNLVDGERQDSQDPLVGLVNQMKLS
jgi:hypothetical protein